MDKNGGPNHLQAWRRFRELTQEELAEKVGTTKTMISMLETGDRGLSVKWLRKLANPLETTPGALLDIDPSGGSSYITLPPLPALEQMFEGLLLSMPGVGRGELAHELATLLPIGLAQLQGPLRYVTMDASDDADEAPTVRDVARPARRRASRK